MNASNRDIGVHILPCSTRFKHTWISRWLPGPTHESCLFSLRSTSCVTSELPKTGFKRNQCRTSHVVPHHAIRRLCVIPKKVLVHLWCNLCSKCYAMDCFATYFAHFTYVPQPGCNDMHCTCTHIRCYAIVFAHMFNATQLHLRTCWMLRNCTCAHVRCYAIALAHMFGATQLYLRTCSMLRNCTLRSCWMLRNLGEANQQHFPRSNSRPWEMHLSKQQFLKQLAKVC